MGQAQVLGGFTGNRKVVYISGNSYDGELLNGKRHGRGTYTFASGSVYEGSFENSLFHGHGKYTWKKLEPEKEEKTPEEKEKEKKDKALVKQNQV